jgi:hypothetical protein
MTKHMIGTRQEWLAAAAGAGVGSNRQGVPIRDRRRKYFASRSLVWWRRHDEYGKR